MSDPLHDFIEAMCAAGCGPANPSDVVTDNQSHYIDSAGDKPRSKKLKYILKVDGDFAVGGFVHYRHGDWHTWTSKLNGKGEYTDEEKKVWRERIDQERAAKEKEREESEKKASHDAKMIWDGAEYARPDHAYLTRKRIKPHNFKQKDGKILIPMYGDKKFLAYQTIDEDGDKLYLAGARKKGCYCPLMEKGEAVETFLFAEGVATGATVREITGLPTIICFDANNLAPVSESFRKRYPAAKFIFAADNDQWARLKPTDPEKTWVEPDHEKNTGIFKAQQACVKVGYARVIWPVFPKDSAHTDFNDLAVTDGEEAVRARIDEALAAPMPAPPKPKKPKPPAIPPPDNRPDRVEWEQQLIFKDKEGVKLAENSINYKLMVCNHARLAHCFAYDEFHLCTMVIQPPPWAEDGDQDFIVHPVSDTDIRNTDYFLQKTKNLNGSKEKTLDAIEECGLNNAFHPARDHLSSLEWDGKPRLDNWLLTYMRGKDDPDYLRAIGKAWLIAAVKRQMEPGCKFDNMLVLEGPQFAGKDLALEIMATFGKGVDARTYFMKTFNIGNCEDTDELMKLSGSVIVDIDEMSGFNKKDDDAMKKFITTTHDTYRAPYGRRPNKWPRQFVLAGTYNPRDGIFKDSTGLRRFWVVATGDRIDLEGLERDREQLWAEAVHRYRQGESILLSEEMRMRALGVANERRLIDDATQDVLRAAKGKRFFETRDILKEMGIPISPGKSQSESRTINEILRTQGFERCRKALLGKSVLGWKPTGDLPEQYEFTQDAIEDEIEF